MEGEVNGASPDPGKDQSISITRGVFNPTPKNQNKLNNNEIACDALPDFQLGSD